MGNGAGQKLEVFEAENFFIFFLAGVVGTGALVFFLPPEKILELKPNSGRVLYI
jgi:hypothetical protein